jgi:hypothetical protein
LFTSTKIVMQLGVERLDAQPHLPVVELCCVPGMSWRRGHSWPFAMTNLLQVFVVDAVSLGNHPVVEAIVAGLVATDEGDGA